MPRLFTKVIVTGGREFMDYFSVAKVLDSIPGLNTVIQGGAKGADACGRAYCELSGKLSHTYHANWGKHGKAAGPIRNTQMLSENKDALVIAFPGGRGTKHCVEEATRLGLPVLVVTIRGDDVFVLAVNEEINLTIKEDH